MRKLGPPDEPYAPRNDLEASVCERLRKVSGKDVWRLWTRAEYSETHCGADDNPIDPGHDFVAWTSGKRGDYYCAGNEYGIDVSADDISISDLGPWNL